MKFTTNYYIYCVCDPINKIDFNGYIWEYLKGIWKWYNKINNFLSDILVNWYILYIDMKTQIALREQLNNWKPLRDDVDWSIFSPLLKESIQDAMKHASDAATGTMKFIYNYAIP